MPFDPSKPANNSALSSAEMRGQLNSLNDKIDANAAQVDIIKLDGSHFSVLYRGNLPLEWAVEAKGEEDGEWDVETVVAGNVMLVGVTGSPYAVRMVGRDAGHNPVTDVSNILILNVPVPVPPTNVVLSYDESFDSASWTYDGNAPAQWELSYSQDSGATWQVGSVIPGSANSSAPDVEPSLMRIRALDGGGSPISDYSNSVNVG